MKSSNKKEYLYFAIPFLLTIAFSMFVFNRNFLINGIGSEFYIKDFLALILINFLTQLIFYFVLFRFVKNKHLLYISECLLVFTPMRKELWIGIIGLILFGIFYKNKNLKVNYFVEAITIILGIMISFFTLFNIKCVYTIISFNVRAKTYTKVTKNKIEDKAHPNIYWLHMDGMTNTSFVNKYYHNNLEEFNNYLSDYYTNPYASFKGGHCTPYALNALFNPNYYDNFFKEYLDNFDYCILNRCKTKKIVPYKDVMYHKINNELISTLNEAGYDTVSIAEFNQYTALSAHYIYNTEGFDTTNRIHYYENKDSVDEIYKITLNNHILGNMTHLTNFNFPNRAKFEKKINSKLSIPEYENLNNTSYSLIRAMINSIEDANKKSDKAKFYFIDHTIAHIQWNYDENGKKLGDAVDDLDNFDNNYIYITKLLMEFTSYIREHDPEAVIVIQGDHGIHAKNIDAMMDYFKIDEKEVLNIRNSTINAVYIPEKYRNGDEEYLKNPLNISRYLINNFIGENYSYLTK